MYVVLKKTVVYEECLPFGVLGVGHCITNDILKENLKNTTGLLVDESRDTFHSTSTGKTTNSWFGDTLDVVTKNFSVTLGTSFSQSLSSFSSSSHFDSVSLAFHGVDLHSTIVALKLPYFHFLNSFCSRLGRTYLEPPHASSYRPISERTFAA